MNWGRAITMSRKRAGLSKRALARNVAIDPSYVTHLEAGTKTPSVDVLERIAQACGVRLSLLVSFGEPIATVCDLCDSEDIATDGDGIPYCRTCGEHVP